MGLNLHRHKSLHPSSDILGKIPLSPEITPSQSPQYNIGPFNNGYDTCYSVPQRLGCQEFRRWGKPASGPMEQTTRRYCPPRRARIFERIKAGICEASLLLFSPIIFNSERQACAWPTVSVDCASATWLWRSGPAPPTVHFPGDFPSSTFSKCSSPFLLQQGRTRPKCNFNYSNNKFIRARSCHLSEKCVRQASYWSWQILFHQPSKQVRGGLWVFCRRQDIKWGVELSEPPAHRQRLNVSLGICIIQWNSPFKTWQELQQSVD